ncbi:MAG: YifB family Mg chelatase-like AAA ATPase [Gammaproteobacteria bacterium]|nr:YifB family Mg chelatase-like AAA ATPase [Gammaproteobacteria bacterium]
MRLATIHSRANVGLHAPAVSVEVHLSAGLPKMSIVGLPEAAVKESKDRVRAAILNSKFDFPSSGRITINLAPADLPKEGGRFDLPIALGILAASRQINVQDIGNYEFVGELGLSGQLRPIKGVLPVALQTVKRKRTLVIPEKNKPEASLVNNIEVLTPLHLLDITAHLNGVQRLELAEIEIQELQETSYPDLADVKGQHHAKRALEIAAAGGHSMLMSGPPGTGKSMLASRLPGILPPMTEQEALESAAIYSISQSSFNIEQWKRRPFRQIHNSASPVALIGGGSNPKPGEISLAHNGVLFLDEMPEFDRKVLEVLREPLETGSITISRASKHATYPSRFQLIAAKNPCPCGYLGDPSDRCTCRPLQIHRYQAKLSGPLLDRIDLHVEVPRATKELFEKNSNEESSETIRRRVCTARELQIKRQHCINTLLEGRVLDKVCQLDDKAETLLMQATHKLKLSARGMHRILKVARTIADLNESAEIKTPHLSEAINLRKR